MRLTQSFTLACLFIITILNTCPAVATPIQTTQTTITTADEPLSSSLFDFIKELIAADQDRLDNIINKALNDILQNFNFLDEFKIPVVGIEEAIDNEIKKTEAEIEKRLNEEINKSIEALVEEESERARRDIEFAAEIILAIPDLPDFINEVEVGSFPKKLSRRTPASLKRIDPNSMNNINYSLFDPVDLIDSRDTVVFILEGANIRLSRIPEPPVYMLILIGFVGYGIAYILSHRLLTGRQRVLKSTSN